LAQRQQYHLQPRNFNIQLQLYSSLNWFNLNNSPLDNSAVMRTYRPAKHRIIFLDYGGTVSEGRCNSQM
jgi:hypothetical protein